MLSLTVLGCTGLVDLANLERRHPVLEAHPRHRLSDAAPYFALSVDAEERPPALALFLCRFQTDEAIPVFLPADATVAERQVLGRALSAWSASGLGLEFAVADDDPGVESARRIEIAFVEVPTEGGPVAAADTIADCAIPDAVPRSSEPGEGERAPKTSAPVAAELVFASVHLRRHRRDGLNRQVPLTEAELLGVLVHELGHALGYPGHVRFGDDVMAAHGQIDAARRWGRRVEAGLPLRSRSLAALYAVPSGARLGMLQLTRAQAAPLRALGGAGRRNDLRGPFVRVGDRDARIFWRSRGESAALDVPNWVSALGDPARFQTRANLGLRLLLGRDGGEVLLPEGSSR